MASNGAATAIEEKSSGNPYADVIAKKIRNLNKKLVCSALSSTLLHCPRLALANTRRRRRRTDPPLLLIRARRY